MKSRNCATSAVTTTLSILIAVVGCAPDPHPVPVPDTVDAAALDPGNYPTTPADVVAPTGPDEIAIRRAQQLADYVVTPVEVDPEIGINGYANSTHVFTPQFPPVEGRTTEADFHSIAPGFVAGWRTEGWRRADRRYGRVLTITVLEFVDSASAEQASKALQAARFRDGLDVPTSIPIHVNAHAHVTSESGEVRAWLASGAYVIDVTASDDNMNPVDSADMADLVSRTFDAQIEAVAAPPPPIDPADASWDTDDLLARTLQVDTAANSEQEQPGVYSRRGALHLMYSQGILSDAYEAAGVDLVARSAAMSIRTRDAESARNLASVMAELEPKPAGESATGEFYADPEVAPSPPGMPGAHCQEWTTTEVSFRCFISADRYVGLVFGTRLEDVHQQAAATYLLLTAK